jgi:hypothetical protein
MVFEAGDAPCSYTVRLHECEPPSRVTADGTPLPRVEAGALDQAEAGWALDGPVVVVKGRARRIQVA